MTLMDELIPFPECSAIIDLYKITYTHDSIFLEVIRNSVMLR